MNVNYRANSFNLVANLHVHLKGRMTYCVDYHFNETIFLPLKGEDPISKEQREIIWNALTLNHLDPCSNKCKLEVQKIIHLQGLANKLTNSFIDAKKMTKSFSLIKNILVQINVSKG